MGEIKVLLEKTMFNYSRTVLIAEQDSIVHTFLHFIFDQMKFNIIDVFSENPHEIYINNKDDLDIIIADTDLKNIHGLELYKKVRYLDKQIYFVLMSTCYEDNFEILTPDENACYLLKPFPLNTLEMIVKNSVNTVK